MASRLPAFAGASFAETAITIEIDAGPVPSGTGPGGVFPVVLCRGSCICYEAEAGGIGELWFADGRARNGKVHIHPSPVRFTRDASAD